MVPDKICSTNRYLGDQSLRKAKQYTKQSTKLSKIHSKKQPKTIDYTYHEIVEIFISIL